LEKLNKVVLLVVLLLISGVIRAQQEYTLHFNRDLIQSNTTNPAINFDYRVSFLFPSVNFNFGNNAFSFNDLVNDDPNSDSTFLDVDGVIGNMSEQNVLQLQSELSVFGMYYSYREWFFSFNMSEKFSLKLTYPKDLFDLLWNGNAKFIGETIDIGPGIHINYYKDVSLGIGRHINKWDVGVNMRFLSGMVNVSSVRNSLKLTTAVEDYAMTLSSDYEIKTSGVNDPLANFLKLPNNLENSGFAVDIGAIYHLSDKWEFSQSFLDLGGIKWENNVATYRSKGSIEYTGVDIAEFIDDDAIDFDDFSDSLQDIFFEEELGGSYWNYLSPESYSSVLFKPDDKTNIGALIHLSYFSTVHFGMSIYAGRQIMKVVNIGFSYSIKNRRYDNVGMNLNLGPKGFKVFVVTDNLFNFLQNRKGRNVTWRYGINVNIGNSDKAKERPPIDEEEEIPQENK